MATQLSPFEVQAIAAYKWAKDGARYKFSTTTPRSYKGLVEAYCRANNEAVADWKNDAQGRSLTAIVTSLQDHGVQFEDGVLSLNPTSPKPKKAASAVSPARPLSAAKPAATSPTLQRANTYHQAPAKPYAAAAVAAKSTVAKVTSPPKVQAAPAAAPAARPSAATLQYQQQQLLLQQQAQARPEEQRLRTLRENLQRHEEEVARRQREKAEKKRMDKAEKAARRREELMLRHRRADEAMRLLMQPPTAPQPAPVRIPSPAVAVPQSALDTRNMAECPVCRNPFPMAQIDSHLDSCLSEGAINDLQEQDRASEKRREDDDLELAIRESARLEKEANDTSTASDSLNRSSASAAEMEVEAVSKKRPAPSAPDVLSNETLRRKPSNGTAIGPFKRFSPAPLPAPSVATPAPAETPVEDDVIFIGVQPGRYFSEQDSDDSEDEYGFARNANLWRKMTADREEEPKHAFGVPNRAAGTLAAPIQVWAAPSPVLAAPTAPSPTAPSATPKKAPTAPAPPPRAPVNLPNSGGLFSERHFTCDQDDKECPICFEEFKKDTVGIMLPCLCLYHLHCIRDWLERKPRNCPSHGDF